MAPPDPVFATEFINVKLSKTVTSWVLRLIAPPSSFADVFSKLQLNTLIPVA